MRGMANHGNSEVLGMRTPAAPRIHMSDWTRSVDPCPCEARHPASKTRCPPSGANEAASTSARRFRHATIPRHGRWPRHVREHAVARPRRETQLGASNHLLWNRALMQCRPNSNNYIGAITIHKILLLILRRNPVASDGRIASPTRSTNKAPKATCVTTTGANLGWQ